MVLALSAVANAYVFQAISSDPDDLNGMATITLKTDTTEKLTNMVANPGNASEIYVTSNGSDRLSQYFLAVEPAVWNLVVSAGSLYASDAVKIKLWSPSTAGADAEQCYELKQGDDVLYKGAFFAAAGSIGVPTVALTLPYADAPIALTFSQCPNVPEPGSMLAMFTGIVGLAGFAIRRRK
jgi:hypothetical protein